MNILVVGSSSYAWPHAVFGKTTLDVASFLTGKIKIDLIVFTGGADINPNLYGQKKNERTHMSPNRDIEDTAVYKAAKENNIPCVGICRGGQFLTAMAGGFLYQHTTNHSMCIHKIETIEGNVFPVSGDHHQMFGVPLAPNAQLLAWSTKKLSDVYLGDSKMALPEPVLEPEVVFYPHINALAVQYHPEWMKNTSEGLKYYTHLISTKLLNKVKQHATSK